MAYLCMGKLRLHLRVAARPPHHSRQEIRRCPPHVFLPERTVCGSTLGDVAGRPAGRERRQFANSHDELSPEAAELATAIDGYKLQHRRRFITFEEMLAVIKSLGYERCN